MLSSIEIESQVLGDNGSTTKDKASQHGKFWLCVLTLPEPFNARSHMPCVMVMWQAFLRIHHYNFRFSGCTTQDAAVPFRLRVRMFRGILSTVPHVLLRTYIWSLFFFKVDDSTPLACDTRLVGAILCDFTRVHTLLSFLQLGYVSSLTQGGCPNKPGPTGEYPGNWRWSLPAVAPLRSDPYRSHYISWCLQLFQRFNKMCGEKSAGAEPRAEAV